MHKNKPINTLRLSHILYIIQKLTGILEDPYFTYTEYGPSMKNLNNKFTLGALPIYNEQDCKITLSLQHDNIIDKCLKLHLNDLRFIYINDNFEKIVNE